MKIAVLNGSPKGADSVTMHSVAHLMRALPAQRFVVLPIARRIDRLVRDEAYYRSFVDLIRGADALVWATPVYIFWVPAQVLRFLELVRERGDAGAFAGKHVTTLTTSIKCGDQTAQAFLGHASEDLGAFHHEGLSLEMYDLLVEARRRSLELFLERFLARARDDVRPPRRSRPLAPSPFEYRTRLEELAPGERRRGERVLLLTARAEPTGSGRNVEAMIEAFRRRSPWPVEVVDVPSVSGSSPWCRGCVHCIVQGRCARADALEPSAIRRLDGAAGLVVAADVSSRSLPSGLKVYFDRQFSRGIASLYRGKPVAFLLSGPLSELAPLRDALSAHVQRGEAADALFLGDECADSDELDRQVQALVDDMAWTVESGFSRPPTFLGRGARMIVRDFVYSMRAAHRLDHQHWSREGGYDFPTSDLRGRALNRLGLAILELPQARRWFERNARKLMLEKLRRDFAFDGRAFDLPASWEALRGERAGGATR